MDENVYYNTRIARHSIANGKMYLEYSAECEYIFDEDTNENNLYVLGHSERDVIKIIEHITKEKGVTVFKSSYSIKTKELVIKTTKLNEYIDSKYTVISIGIKRRDGKSSAFLKRVNAVINKALESMDDGTTILSFATYSGIVNIRIGKIKEE